jgi:hypothetical protein
VLCRATRVARERQKGVDVKRIRPWRTNLPTLLSLMLVAVLVVGLTLSVTSCRSLDSDTTQTTAPPETAGTDTTTAVQGSAGTVSAANVLFRDDFQDGDSEGWQVSGAWVVQQDGDVYTFDTTGTGFAAVPKGVSWEGDYAFKASYLLTAGTLAFSFDATTGGRYYVPIDAQRISLVKEDASGNKTVLTQAQAPETGKLHYITMAKQRGTIQVYVDKTLWLAAQDAAPLATGTVAVGSTGGTTASVDNVLVNKITRTLPQGTPAVAAIAPGQVVDPLDDGADLGELDDSGDGGPGPNDNNNPDDLPLPTVQFVAWTGGNQGSESLSVPAGSEVILSWNVQDAQEVFLDGVAAEPVDTQVVTPAEDTVYTLTVTDLVGGQHDYTVTDKGSGTSANIAMTVTNLGDQDVSGAVFRWYAHATDGVVSKTSTVSVPAGHSVSLGLTYDYGQHGTMHWKATIDEDEHLPDINGGNNSTSGTVTIP